MRCIFCNISRLHRASRRVFLSVPWGRTKKRSGNTPQRSESSVKAVRGAPGDRPRAFRNIRDTLRSVRFGIFGTHSWRGRSGRSESLRTEALRNIRNPLRTGRSGADCSFGPFADGSDADRTVSGCGYLISRSGCSRRKCSQLCDPLREAAFLPPPSPLTRSGPRTAWSGLEVV